MILLRPICWLLGHKRGKLVGEQSLGVHSAQTGRRIFACPRCGRTTKYKAKPPKVATAPTDGSPHFQELA